MTISRVSTYAIHQATLSDVSRTQARLAELQGQISSGNKTDRFQGLDTQVEQFVALEDKIARSDTYIENNAVTLSRVQTTRTVMSEIIDLVDDMENLIVARRNPATGESLQFTQQMVSMREQLAQMMNTTLEGRHLFGGTRTNAPPMPNDPTTIIPGVPDASYYQGSSEPVMARLADNIEIDYSVRGDDPAFQKVVAAIYQSLRAGDNGQDDLLEDAQSLITDGLKDLIGVQAKVDANVVAIQNISERHGDLKSYWQGVRDELIGTDIVAASTQVSIDQTILQASFQSFATLNRLRLADFL